MLVVILWQIVSFNVDKKTLQTLSDANPSTAKKEKEWNYCLETRKYI